MVGQVAIIILIFPLLLSLQNEKNM